MNDMKRYADIILGDKVVLEKSMLDPILEDISKDIHACPVRSRGRPYNKIRKSVDKMALEYALDKLGFPLNSIPFDKTNRESYCYDNILNGDTFECKNFHKAWYSYDSDHVATMKKNLDRIKYFVSGRVDITEDQYIVEFMLIANANTFFKYQCRSNFPNAQFPFYYNHYSAVRDGQAIFRSV